MKTKVTIPPTFSDEEKVLNFTLPTSWSELTQNQLRYVTRIFSFFPAPVAKVMAFKRFTGIMFIRRDEQGWHMRTKAGKDTILFRLTEEDIFGYISKLNWMLSPGEKPVRLDEIGDFCAVDADLHEVPFGDYLVCENLYQGFLQTRENDHINRMASILYRDKYGHQADKIECNEGEILSVFLWFAACKNQFAKAFPYFFRTPSEDEDYAEQSGMVDRMNAQIRALTGGDITKEQQVLDMDCWRALTELNEKAREAAEFKKKYGK